MFVSIHNFQVVVPKTYSKYTSRRVLTTQWIEGEKLSQSTASDVGDLVNVGVICYLKQVSRSYLCLNFFFSDYHFPFALSYGCAVLVVMLFAYWLAVARHGVVSC